MEQVVTNASLSPREKGARLRECENLGDCVEGGLRASLDAGDWKKFYWYVLATDLAPRESYVPILVEALEMARGEPRIHAADVVSVLSDLASPESVRVLARTVAWRPNGEGGADLALDAMDALLHIDTPESREAIASLVSDDRAEVRELARDVVDNPGQFW
ncbi:MULTISPECIES: hypothetical protein [Amycolatopsis]|uniref:hypothetical protein n=1 Tax=Amycolatopsis sp. cg13 TaxID=3238807 RepID=UPI003523CFA8